jgi:hypothetical protein
LANFRETHELLASIFVGVVGDQAAGADGKNAVVKAYHSNTIPTESVSTGKENLKIIA